MNANGHAIPGTYEKDAAREFRYDPVAGGPRARYAEAFYDDLIDADPNEWHMTDPVRWTEYAGVSPYVELEVSGDPNSGYDVTPVRRYLGTSGDEPLDEEGAPLDTRFYHGDLIGSTGLLTDQSGASSLPAVGDGIVAYTAFGEVLTAGGSPGGSAPEGFPRYQYAGAYGYESGGFGDDARLLSLAGVNPNLPSITLEHVGHRWYQPDIGRFIQRDPIGIQGGLNVYAYIAGSPLDMVDPTGLTSMGPPEISDEEAAEAAKGLGGFIVDEVTRHLRPIGKAIYNGCVLWSWVQQQNRNRFQPKLPRGPVVPGPSDRLEPGPPWEPPAAPRRRWRWPRWPRFRWPGVWDPFGCFVEGTTIWMESGPRGAQDIRVGDSLMAMDPYSGRFAPVEVTRVHQVMARRFVIIDLGDESLQCTERHPFWVIDVGWVPAASLRAGDELQNANGQSLRIESLRCEVWDQPVPVYNITVEGYHTYHVGASRVLVHNKQ